MRVSRRSIVPGRRTRDSHGRSRKLAAAIYELRPNRLDGSVRAVNPFAGLHLCKKDDERDTYLDVATGVVAHPRRKRDPI